MLQVGIASAIGIVVSFVCGISVINRAYIYCLMCMCICMSMLVRVVSPHFLLLMWAKARGLLGEGMLVLGLVGWNLLLALPVCVKCTNGSGTFKNPSCCLEPSICLSGSEIIL